MSVCVVRRETWVAVFCNPAFLCFSVFFYVFLVFLCFFPNRSLLLRVLIEVQRGGAQKHTQAVKRSERPAGPESRELFQNSSRILAKVKILSFMFVFGKFFSGKTNGFFHFLQL